MENKRLKKLTAMLLSITMVFSIVANAFPAALAAGESVSTPSVQDTTSSGDLNYSTNSHRPRLYVDFLGDNKNYFPSGGTIVSGGKLDGLAVPGSVNQSKVTNDNETNTWEGYKSGETYTNTSNSIYDGETIFWVGVGIDRMNLLELLKDGNGIYGLELGFYYDSTYIEPYTGGTANSDDGYKAVLEAANINNNSFSHQWTSDYKILEAHTNMEPQTDPVTQEVIQKPAMSEILSDKDKSGNGANTWKMTYVSLEYTATNVDNERFKGEYGTEKADTDTQYIMMIPFRLKNYDTNYNERVCLRLTRSAGLFSISGGEGNSPYAAWERVTTRNPNRELKLMAAFQGDLNIFSGGRYLEPGYSATLKLNDNALADKGNTAVLKVKDDPSYTPDGGSYTAISVNKNGGKLTGLHGGTGMQLDVTVGAGYKVTVTVYHEDDPDNVISRTEVWADEYNSTYTFVMPEDNVIVQVDFTVTDATMFNLYLDERMQDGSDITTVTGNYTTVTATYAAPIDNATSPTTVTTVTQVDRATTNVSTEGWRYEKVHTGSTVEAEVSVHGDYEAVVYFSTYVLNGGAGTVLAIDAGTVPADARAEYDTSGNVKTYILPTGGQVRLNTVMPQNDVVFHVEYRPATRRTVELEIYNDVYAVDRDAALRNNVGQLSTTMYDNKNEGHTGYSGVVYENLDAATLKHSQVESNFRVLDLVDVSSATGSGSLGGDGRTPMAWNGSADSLMAKLYNAASATDLNSVTPLDLRWDSVATAVAALSATGENRQPTDGLRKNAVGEFYNDTDISDFREKLYTLKTLIVADIATNSTETTWVTTVTNDSGAVLYSYYNLTREQVQQYLLDWEKYEVYQAELDEYNAAYTQYTADLAAYDAYNAAYQQYKTEKDAAEAAGGTYTGVEIPELALRKPVEPTKPATVTEPALPATVTSVTLSGFTWYTPTVGFTAPDSTNMAEAYKLEVRPNRQVAVTLEASSKFEVKKVVLVDRSNGNHADVTVKKNAAGKWTSTDSTVMAYSTLYQNEVVLTMPDYDCAVQVYYGVRATHDLTLNIVGDYWYDNTANIAAPTAADKTNGVNYVEVTGYVPNSTAGSVTAATFGALDKNGDTQTGVLEGSTVTVKVYKSEKYTASIMVHYENGTVSQLWKSDDDLDDGETFTFTMPAGATKITVTYTDNTPEHKAYLQVEHAENTTSNSDNKGEWQGTGLTVKSAREGEALVGEVKVAPGYYIAAVIAYTESGSYPFTISGNGWNNGLGAGYGSGFDPVLIKTTMPDEDYWVRVIIKQGPPEKEPTQFLSLRVNDEKNKTAPYVDNYATATVGGTTTLGPVGKAQTKGMYDLTYTTAGETVTVNIHAESGYTITSVELEPVGTTVPLTWKSATYDTDGKLTDAELEFVMPSVSTTVVVTFDTVVEIRDRLYLNISKTKNGEVVTGDSTKWNRLLTVTSPTIVAAESAGSLTVPDVLPATMPSGTNSTGIAKKGETVKLTLNVDPKWYVHSLTLYGDEGGLSYTLKKQDGTDYDPAKHFSTTDTLVLEATFVMPDSDVTLVVNYRDFTDKPAPDNGKHLLELVVEDPDNTTTPYVDNYASAVVDGTRSISTLGKGTTGNNTLRGTTTAYVGEEVVISYTTAQDYALEVILATSEGVRLPVTYFTEGSQVKARFTMPDSDATAVVRFVKGVEKTYTANLVLYYPDGTLATEYDSIGEGSFRVAPSNGLDSGRSKLYSMTATAGQKLDFDLLAHDGYYISAVTVTSAALGVTADYTGAFGWQSGVAYMPAADIQINVFFAKGWPDDIQTDPTTVGYDLTLRVYDTANSGTKSTDDSNANFVSVNGVAQITPNSDKVYGNESKIIQPVYDEDQVVVGITPKAGSYVKSITVTDSRGNSLPWQYVAGGIVFAMSPAHVTVTVTFAKLDENVTRKNYNVTLHTDAADGASKGTVTVTHPTVSGETITVDNTSFATAISVPAYGQGVKLEVKPETDYYVKQAYAVSHGDGAILPLTHTYTVGTDSYTEVTTGMPQVAKGGTVTFAMPADNVDVYVYFGRDTDENAPKDGDYVGTLTVVGEKNSGSGVMYATEKPAVTTGAVSATGAGSLFAPGGTELTVELNVTSGYSIQTIRVTDGYGEDISYTWNADGKSFTLTMPTTNGVRVYVELVENDTTKELTAQVVVNNGGEPQNTATLSYNDGTSTITGNYLSPVYAGGTIRLDVTVKAGYRVEYVKIVPARLGLSAALNDGTTTGTLRNQDGSFTMPNEDVVVYVKFTKDERERKTVTLFATGLADTVGNGNSADLTNEYTGETGDKTVYPDSTNNTTTVDAAPATTTTAAEWVKVDYRWAEGYCVKTITVKDAAGNNVPFTQNENQAGRTGEIRFPMVNSDNVKVTVEWAKEEDLLKYKAILHVIDLDDPAMSNDSTGKLTWTTETTGDINSVYRSTKDTSLKPGEEYIEVPAGERVDVNIKAQSGTYIKAAYVLYREGGQMIRFNLTPDANGDFVGEHNDFFIMHRGQCDVYVYFTTVKPDSNDYSAVLMLDSDTDDTVSTATISRLARTGETVGASATVTANVDDHGYITATKSETITVSVKPASGYVLDYILMTPLGIEASQGGTVVLKDITATAGTDGYTYTFEMPAENVAVYVKLKKGTDTTKYKAYLNCYFIDLDTTPHTVTAVTDQNGSWTQVSFKDGASLVQWWECGTYREVPEHTEVTVDAMLKADNWILAAYVLNDNGELVSLNEAMEGKTDTHPGDAAAVDATAKFEMPSEDVHIYVWFTAKKPTAKWHTAVLTVVDTDPSDPTNNNSGKNSATIQSNTNNKTPVEVWSLGEPAHQFIWVEDDEKVTVKTDTIHQDYIYINTTLTTNVNTTGQRLTPDLTNDNACTYTVPDANTAAVVRYQTSEIKDVPLHVVLVDRDNPNKVPNPDTNAVTVKVQGGTIPDLTVKSVTSAGARQTIPAVTTNKQVTFNVTPESGYSYIAVLKDSKGNVKITWNLNTDGSFRMLSEETTLEIYFFKDNEVTLTVQDTRTTPPLSKAEMTATGLGLTAKADTTPTVGTLHLPEGTQVEAKMTEYGDNKTKLMGVLVTTKDGTFSRTVDSDPMASYTETVQGKTDIRFVLGGADKNEYIASVSAVNLPNGTALPTIKVTVPTENSTHGDQWTVAESGNTVEVTVTVPAGYQATLTATGGASLSTTLVTNTGTSESTETITFTMPADNVHVTVTYKKVRFTATVQVAGQGSGSATLTHGTTVTATKGNPDSISGLSENDTVDYNATANSGSTLSHILKRTESGASELLTAPNDSFTMPAEDVTVTAFFDMDGETKHHIAYVTTVNTDNQPDNAAQSIANTSDSTLNAMGGVIYTYGDKGHNIFVNFTTAAGYQAIVTAKNLTTTSVVYVTQQGTSGNCTASLTMPDADVEIIITYTKSDVKPTAAGGLTLRLVGHEQNIDNKATLTYDKAGGTGTIPLATTVTSTDPLYSNTVTDAVVGGTLDLDAWRNEDFIFERMTVATWNGDKTNPTLYTEVELSWNEYLTNGVSLFTMPNAETLVTVYYGHPYKATLFVIDKKGDDYHGGIGSGGNATPRDTAEVGNGKVPTVKMEATDTAGAPTGNPTDTTKTHTSIEDLRGTETITTTVDSTTMPADSEIASVIASTKSGTVHLTDTTNTNTYKYLMSGLPDRRAENVDITVVLRDANDTRKLHTATVYKVGHDDLNDNSAKISNTTSTTLPKGTIWTAGYENDALILTVTTAEGYYALVTAKDSDGNTVPVVQWAVTGDSTTPILVDFVMPDMDLDITVTYIKGTPLQETLKLTLVGHGQKSANKATVRGGAGAVSAASPSLLNANGGMAPDGNTYSVSKDTDVGTYLLTETATDGDYYVKSVEMKVTVGGMTYTYDLTSTTFVPRVPVGGAEIIVTFEQGKVTGRPYDPEHSETYNSATSNPAGTNPYQNGTTTGENPDLSVAPPNSPMSTTDEREGWILAESVDVTGFTFVVTVPTLFDKNEKNADGTLNKSGALSNAGVDTATTDTPPEYTFYWWNKDASEYVKFDTELTVTAQSSLSYADNPKGDYPAGDHHYGYQLTLQATLPANAADDTAAQALLRKCFEEGGVIYVTAKNQKALTDEGGKTIPWIESEKTQVIVRPDNVLKPYDPDNKGSTTYNDHWIKAENRGDYLIVTVPMLNNKSGDTPTEVDDSTHRFRLYLQDNTGVADRAGNIVDVTDLLNIVNVKSYENKWNQNLEYQDGWTRTGDLFEPYYENEVYYTDTSGTTPVAYHGARFVVTILTDDAIDADSSITDKTTAKANAAILRQIFDNEGTMGINKYRMYITSDEATSWTATTPTFRTDDYADFEVPRYYTLSGVLNSWAPTHIAELSLYRVDETASTGSTAVYETDAAYRTLSGLVSIYDDGRYTDEAHPATHDPAIYNNRWYTGFAFKSSALVDGTYKLVVEKAAHITYTHTEIELTVPQITVDYYDSATQTFSFTNEIGLFCGDLAPVYTGGNQKINGVDRDYLSLYLYGNAVWTKVTPDDAASDPNGWVNSIYNPDSYAYAADLDGNGSFSERDWTILMSSFNWKKSVSDYGSPSGLTATSAALLMAAIELPELFGEDTVYDVTEDTELIDGVIGGDTAGDTKEENGGITADDNEVYRITEDTELIGGVSDKDNVYHVTADTELIGDGNETETAEPPKAPTPFRRPEEDEPAVPAPSTEEDGEESPSEPQTE